MASEHRIDEVWGRIRQHEGATFRQVRGKEFMYSIEGEGLRPSTTNWLIARRYFEETLALVPLDNTVPLQHLRRSGHGQDRSIPEPLSGDCAYRPRSEMRAFLAWMNSIDRRRNST